MAKHQRSLHQGPKPMDLTEGQKKAINHIQGPAITIAGPGVGKTFVITERVKNLIENHHIDPKNILVTTFTEKAANELKVRLAKTVGKKAETIHISTIHSFCKSMLEKYFLLHNFGADINVIDDESQSLILDLNKTAFGLAKWSSAKKRVVEVKQSFNLIKDVKSFFDKLTTNRIDPDRLINELKKNGQLLAEDEKVIHAYKAYREHLQAEKKMDFAMLQSEFYSLITEHPDVLEDIQLNLTYIMVDEYQDTSPIQDRIFNRVAGKTQNLFVVGDQNQSIYKFRGASVRNFMKFKEKYPNAREYLLNVNFRSTKRIINLANQVFYASVKKTLEAKRRAGEKIRLIWGETSEETAEKSIHQIIEMKDSGIIDTYGDVALLFRSLKNHSHEFIKYLERARIPYVTYGDGKFFERDEIQTMLFLLSYVTQELYIDNRFKNWQHWWRRDLFLSDFFGFSEETREVIRSGKFKLFELETTEDFNRLGFTKKRDIDVLLKLNHLKQNVEQEKLNFEDIEKSKYSLLVIFYKILDYTGFFKRILGDRSPENREKLQNLGRLSQIIRKYIETRKKEDVKGFFWYVYQNAESFDQEKLEDPGSVKLLTVHRAKGMEFPVVFLCCVNEGRFPLRYREDAFIPIPQNLLDAEDMEQAKAEFFDEEKRLFYVGLTRAQDVLIFTGSNKHRVQRWKKSRFLEGLPQDLFSDDKFQLENEKHYERPKETPMLDYSAINAFIDCPFRYDLVYNFGFTTPASFTQTMGFFIHNTLQRIHENMKKGQTLSPEQIEQIVRTYWIALPMSKKKNEDMRKNFVKRFIQYYDNVKKKFMEILAIEESFSHIDDNMIIKGKADLILKDNNGEVCLVDFKARTCKGIHETFVDRQLRIYDYCLDNEYNIEKLFAYTFYDNEMVSFSKNKAETAGFLKEISEDICHEIYSSHKNPNCPGCEFDFCC